MYQQKETIALLKAIRYLLLAVLFLFLFIAGMFLYIIIDKQPTEDNHEEVVQILSLPKQEKTP